MGLDDFLALGLIAMLLMVFGAGRISVDRLFRRTNVEGEKDDDLP